MIEIIPAIMPDSFKDMRNKLSLVAPFTKSVQLDIMDGKFVKGRTWPYFSSDKFTFEDLLNESEGMPYWDKVDFEIDLMVDKPEEVIDGWITAGASRIIVHIESTDKMDEIIKMMHARFAYEGMTEKPDVELGIALNIDTPISEIVGYLEDVQFVQFMGIAIIGLQGEPFDERVLDKIREFHNAHPEITISVDGGVSYETAPMLVEAGAKRLVSGSTIFNTENPAGAIEYFKDILRG
ncbi:MAG: ribulose-phosphate 3-epimerase, ribulose-phosphate 3-epimerase [Candidatus Paceibacter sp.]|jgi:ribulose-phosphate 3-epimerase|nr:ribulose-phosphate 3-epimerase, ribulose-phosphate 3-epimerase [Candidatus Paceibacter sp.]